MDIKVGDTVRVKRFKLRPPHWSFLGGMDYLMGQVVTVSQICDEGVKIAEDKLWLFKEDDFEPVNVRDSKPALPFDIKRIIYNDPATIILWADGTRTVVKAHNEPFDREKGLAMAILKKMLGRGFHRFLKENCADKE